VNSTQGTLYRADIDGLRAISVLGVILFHAGLGGGGFVGVDVFFVISGFLITGLLLDDLNQGTYSLRAFWLRRIRRILPAALVMLVAVLTAGYVVMLPEDLVGLGRSTLAQLSLVANIFFWRDTGYFAIAAELKPLLHTWSLAVEEQFYLFFPPLLTMLYRCGLRCLKTGLCFFTLASFLLSLHGMASHPSATFYLLPTRAWELLVGSLLAIGFFRRGFSSLQAEILAVSGMVGILSSMLVLNKDSSFPGLAALPPVLGSALVILGNSHHLTLVARLLSLSPLTYIGKISYSLYLWHWPVLAMGKYAYDGAMPVSLTTLLIGCSFLLAISSFHFVENPIRRRRLLAGSWSLLTGLSLVSILSFGVGAAFHFGKGFPERLLKTLSESETRVYVGDLSALRQGELPRLGDLNADRPSFIVWGDSHAGVTMNMFDRLGRELGLMGLSAGHGGNPPLPEVDISWNADLREWNSRVLQVIEEKEIRCVFLVARWASFVEGATDYDQTMGIFPNEPLIFDRDATERSCETSLSLFQERLRALCQRLLGKGCSLYVLFQVPEQRVHTLRRAFISERTGGWVRRPCVGCSREEHKVRQRRTDGCFLEAKQRYPEGLHLINFDDLLFDIKGETQLVLHGDLVYRDHHHLTDYGVELLWSDQLRPVLQRLSDLQQPTYR
jgi:peptidoglycan/LPS O-acetylase OafA/YrhL